MKQTTKDRIIEGGFIVLKLLTTVKTGLDTYIASTGAHIVDGTVKLQLKPIPLLNVTLIDLAFTLFWGVVAYGGNDEKVVAIKPLMAAGAWFFYLIMLGIGIFGGESIQHINLAESLLALGARLAVGVMLFRDTRVYRTQINLKLSKETVDDWQNRLANTAIKNRLRVAYMWDSMNPKGLSAVYADRLTKLKITEVAENSYPGISKLIYKNGNGTSQTPRLEQPSNGGKAYILLPDGNIQCATCGWKSNKKDTKNYNRKIAYERHEVSRLHQEKLNA